MNDDVARAITAVQLDDTVTNFVELMSRLFQMDEASALDFGIYRVIRRRNEEVKRFLGELRAGPHGSTVLEGGRLQEILSARFEEDRRSETEALERQLQEKRVQLGIDATMNGDVVEQHLARQARTPIMRPHIEDYRDLQRQLDEVGSARLGRVEVLNRLYDFFSRHYQGGDFVVSRRIGDHGARYIKSLGGDTEVRWATEDMYYIKSGESFADWTIRLSNGATLVFTLNAETFKETREGLQPTDKTHLEIDRAANDDSGRVVVRLHYRKGAGIKAHADKIVAAVREKAGGDEDEIRRRLRQFVERNKSDFFIHKRLRESLREDLDAFIKMEVLKTDALMAGASIRDRHVKLAESVHDIGGAIIDFLAVLEDFQRALWEKRKLVFETRYVVTLDRLAALAGPEWLEARIDAIIAAQKAEWRALGLGDIETIDECRKVHTGDLAQEARVQWLPLPLDTGKFDSAFKWDMLAAVTAKTPLDAAVDTVAIKSDSWQALNTLTPKYEGRIKCIYIDPPYNTKTDAFPYKDNYPHASWLAMIESRLERSVGLLARSGALFSSIDDAERDSLTQALNRTFGARNRVEEIIWAQNTTKNTSPTYSTNHEYVEVYARDLEAAKAEPAMFRELKPGAKEILEVIKGYGESYPPLAQVKQDIVALFKENKRRVTAALEEQGVPYDSKLDPWRGVYNYKNVEYRDGSGDLVDEAEARTLEARVWVWQEDNPAIPIGGGTWNNKTIFEPDNENYRFYKPLHPVTKKPCPTPKTGWRFPKSRGVRDQSFDDLNAKSLIVWGNDENRIPRIKRFLHEVYTQVSQSVFHDYSDGEKELTALTGSTRSFPNPKPTTLISRFVGQTTGEGDWVLDYTAGSGTTFQAVRDRNAVDGYRRKTILIEGLDHFDSVMLPRIKKCAAGKSWSGGAPKALDGPGVFARVQALEQYEDTLETVRFADGDAGEELRFDDRRMRLSYRLREDSRQPYCDLEHFAAPFGYTVQCAQGAGEPSPRAVDLIESLVYLAGLHVAALRVEAAGVLLTATDALHKGVLVLFRDCGHAEAVAWTERHLAAHPAGCYPRVLVNRPGDLTVADGERLEAIEAMFHGQFEAS